MNASDNISAHGISGENYTRGFVTIFDGNYLIHVMGDDPTTQEKDGAAYGEAISFRINGDAAFLLAGSDNIWTTQGNKTCNIEVPELLPDSQPGGPYNGLEGNLIQFDGSASSGINHNWNFGDGNTGTGISPQHAYSDEGTYIVSLTVQNSTGQSDSDNTTAVIVNVAPQNVDAGPNQTGNEGDDFNFSGSASDPGVNDILSYSWNFGDGSTGSGQDPMHFYTDNGVYNVVLTVRDGDGGFGADNLKVTVSNVAPTANAGGPYTGTVNQSIQFNGSATDPGSADTHIYTWDLDDDGEFDDYVGRNPERTFASGGTYTVSLKVTDNDGGSDTDKATVTITEAEIAPDISVSPSSRNYGNVIVGSSSTRSFTVSNGGTADLNVTSTSIIGSGDFSITSKGGSFILAPIGSREVEVQFRPGSVGSKNGTLRLINNDPDENPKDVSLSGNGTAQPCTLWVHVDPIGSGTTVPTAGQHLYDRGEVVYLIATEGEGFTFLNWVGDVADLNSANTTVTMDANKTVTAYFDQDDKAGPYITHCYPPDSARFIPRNTPIQFTIADRSGGEGVDSSSIHLIVNDTTIISRGNPQLGRNVVL
ncbi:hypothetical protein BVY01_05130 [bacterium I07]|nr:hypothetical protein BVY01_05130 [bacterium I07]